MCYFPVFFIFLFTFLQLTCLYITYFYILQENLEISKLTFNLMPVTPFYFKKIESGKKIILLLFNKSVNLKEMFMTRIRIHFFLLVQLYANTCYLINQTQEILCICLLKSISWDRMYTYVYITIVYQNWIAYFSSLQYVFS